MKEIIKNTKLFLTTQEINNLTQNILKVFDTVESSRIAKLRQKKKLRNNMKIIEEIEMQE